MCRLFAMGAVLLLTVCRAADPQLPELNWEPRSDWLNVRDFGAVGDGKADDTAAIQAAFAKIGRGVTVYFPPGVYRITRTLTIVSPNESALYGAGGVIGHGRTTRLVWDGEEGADMIRQEGMAYSRWVGLDLDGGGKAAVGQHHFSEHTFETAHCVRHVAYRNFTKAGVLAAPDDAFAMAETAFENCLFLNCGIGVSFVQFNDYDITFDGCEFRHCGIGVRSWHGNYYIRNCHFAGSTDVDVDSASEHGNSVRRTTSRGSRQFLRHANPVATLMVEGCHVAGWGDPAGAMSVSGAPVCIADTRFSDPPAGATCAIRVASHHQRVVGCGNVVPDGLPLYNPETANRAGVRIFEVPPGEVAPVSLAADQQFFTDVATVPGKVFDAKRDFGAKGDNATDDTAAIQAAVDAAREHGQGAMAYVPAGRYVVKDTLRVTGSDYMVGGAGLLATYLTWRGPADGVTIAVDGARGVAVEQMNLEKATGTSIRVTDESGPADVVVDALFVSKRAKQEPPPFPPGLHCLGLGAQSTVLVKCLVGNMHVQDSGAATILVPVSYYGALTVEGAGGAGLTGFLSRFSGGSWNVIVRDNLSLVMSDYYSENSGTILRFEGKPGQPPGRVTVQAAKLHLNENLRTNVIDVAGYAGQVFLGSVQVNGRAGAPVRVAGGEPFALYLFAACFYHAALTGPGADTIGQLANIGVGKIDVPLDEVVPTPFADTLPADRLAELAPAFDDLRRLGRLDLRLNHPNVPRGE